MEDGVSGTVSALHRAASGNLAVPVEDSATGDADEVLKEGVRDVETLGQRTRGYQLARGVGGERAGRESRILLDERT